MDSFRAHLNLDAHDTLESMALCTDLSGIRDNDIWFCAVIFGRVRRLYSSKSCNPELDLDELQGNAVIDSPLIFLEVNARNLQ